MIRDEVQRKIRLRRILKRHNRWSELKESAGKNSLFHILEIGI